MRNYSQVKGKLVVPAAFALLLLTDQKRSNTRKYLSGLSLATDSNFTHS